MTEEEKALLDWVSSAPEIPEAYYAMNYFGPVQLTEDQIAFCDYDIRVWWRTKPKV